MSTTKNFVVFEKIFLNLCSFNDIILFLGEFNVAAVGKSTESFVEIFLKLAVLEGPYRYKIKNV